MSRPWRLIVVAAAMLVVVALLVPIGYGVKFLGKGRQVRAEIARIRAAGEPMSAADLAGKPIPDSENGAVIYENAFKLLPSKLPPSLGDFLDSDKRSKDPMLWTQARQIVRQYAPALELAREAAARPKCRFEIDWSRSLETEIPQYVHLRSLATLSAARAVLEAKEGHTEDALRSVDLAFGLSDALKDEPVMLAALTRYAIVKIASGALWSVGEACVVHETQARRLADVIASVDLRGSINRAMQGERIVGIALYDRLCRGDWGDSAEDRKMAKALRLRENPLVRLALRNDEAYYLREMKSNIENSELPYRELVRRHLDREPELPKSAIMAPILLPVYGHLASARDSALAELAGDQLYLGLLAYRSRLDAYPENLDDLRKIDWQLPKDPFSGKPFVYRRRGSGFVLYSIGDDLRDNGGIEPKPYTGSRPPTAVDKDEPGDIVWKRDR